jgi:hypothetical protein
MNTQATTLPQPELLQHVHPLGTVVRENNHTGESQLGHFAVYYSYTGSTWVYSCHTADPVATLQAWLNARAGRTLPAFAFQELTARPAVSA